MNYKYVSKIELEEVVKKIVNCIKDKTIEIYEVNDKIKEILNNELSMWSNDNIQQARKYFVKKDINTFEDFLKEVIIYIYSQSHRNRPSFLYIIDYYFNWEYCENEYNVKFYKINDALRDCIENLLCESVLTRALKFGTEAKIKFKNALEFNELLFKITEI